MADNEILKIMDALYDESGYAVLLIRINGGWRARLECGGSEAVDCNLAIDALREVVAYRLRMWEETAAHHRKHAAEAEGYTRTLNSILLDTEEES